MADIAKELLPSTRPTSLYRVSSKNERLNDTKARAPPTLVYLLFLLKVEDNRAILLRANVRDIFLYYTIFFIILSSRGTMKLNIVCMCLSFGWSFILNF